MSLITEAIVENVEGSYIETYLNQNRLKRTDEEAGISVVEWVNNLLNKDLIDVIEFEKFLFRELLMGKRKLIRLYQLSDIRKIKLFDDWIEIFKENFGVTSMNFNAILDTFPDTKNRKKIAAIHSEENEKGELASLQILFVCLIEVAEREASRTSYAYIPVDINFTNETMLIKAWNRYNVLFEEERAEALLDRIKDIMSVIFHISTRHYMIQHKKVLYNMSKGLVDDIYQKIPAFRHISVLNNLISDFEQRVLTELPIEHISVNEEGKRSVPKGVMDFSDEIKKAMERLAISDYFYDRSYDEIWQMGVEAVISRIKFSDNENVLTSLSGEDSEKPIFCTKTFMYLKKSMEDSKLVERLWVVKSRNRGKLSIRYDAMNDEYLGIMIMSGIRYTEEDLKTALEMYKNYEPRALKTIEKNNKRNVS